jgi:ketosteroid isomerase-like protein
MLQAVRLIAVVTLVTAVLPPDTIPPALAKMADTARAFAKRALEVGARDAFIEYFADESVGFVPDPGPARKRIQDRPAPPPNAPRGKLIWEPRFGDIAASGDLGYLTGPVEQVSPAGQVAYANYFSVWKKQPDGQYRVILDVGSDQPSKTPFADGFVRSPAVGAYKGNDTKAAADASLLNADKAFSENIARGAADAFRSAMHPAARLHRSGYLSMTSSTDAAKWLREHVKAMTSTPMKSETAASRDLGYTWGSFTVTISDDKPPASAKATAGKQASSPKPGYYVRVGTRKADGAWQLVADISEASR